VARGSQKGATDPPEAMHVTEGFAMPRRYLRDENRKVPGNAPQKVGVPRVGHGTVYLNVGRDEFGEYIWTGVWIDEFDEPDADGALFGSKKVAGSRDEVIAWVRSQPAASHVVLNPRAREWSPLPENNTDVEL
jgi:hypothetical protein